MNVRRTDWRVVALATTALLLGGPLVHADDALPTGTNELRSVAEKGDPVAQLCLGIRYYAGWHKDPTRIAEAEKWFRLSAAQGNAQAEERLGQLYYLGRDQSPDYPEAVAWFRKAAEHGNREAQLRLAQMYREGKGVAVDRDEAKKWSDLAAQSPPSTPCYPRTEMVESPAGAATAASLPDFPDLRREAEKGNADAQFRLGERYYDERVRDAAKDAEAQKWLRMAAAQGNGQAEDRLGWIYYRGNGVPQDYIEAAQWYRRGAEHGNVDAMTRLGNMYREGQGVSRDPDQARKLINKANDIATRPARQREYEWLAGIMVGMAAFAGALMLLQRKKISGWRRVVLASFIHIVGIALVLNSLITYGLPQLLFPKCSAGAFLSTDCWNYKDLAVRHFATELHDWQMVNLIWRFMVFFGFVFDALAIWYVAYLCLPLFPAWRRRAQRA
jgi:TPR repeat protein